MEAEKVSAPGFDPNDASQHTITLRAPDGVSAVYLMSGRAVCVPANRRVAMSPEHSKLLVALGWTQIMDLGER